MAKEILYRSKTLEELKQMGHAQLADLLKTRARRTLKRGLTEQQKKLLAKVNAAQSGKGKPIKTHCRDMIVLPEMVGMKIHIHNGRAFLLTEIQPEMVGHFLGEFALTRSRVKHSAPGIGATRSSAGASVK